MRIGNGSGQCWLWVVPDACSQGSRRRVRASQRSGPSLVVSTTDGHGLSRRCSAATAPILRAVRRCAGHTGTSRVCESAIFVPQGSPVSMGTAMAVRAAREGGTKPGVGTGEDGEGKACSTSAIAGPLSE